MLQSLSIVCEDEREILNWAYKFHFCVLTILIYNGLLPDAPFAEICPDQTIDSSIVNNTRTTCRMNRTVLPSSTTVRGDTRKETVYQTIVWLRIDEHRFFVILSTWIEGESMETQPLSWKKIFWAIPQYGNDGASMKNSFGRKKFVVFTWDSGEPDRFLGTSKTYFSLFPSL